MPRWGSSADANGSASNDVDLVDKLRGVAVGKATARVGKIAIWSLVGPASMSITPVSGSAPNLEVELAQPVDDRRVGER